MIKPEQKADKRSRAAGPRMCRCGAVLAADNRGSSCASCARSNADRMERPPVLPPDFFDTPQFRTAFASRQMGKVFRVYRTDPRHWPIYGRDGIPQDVLASWLGTDQPHVSRMETGRVVPQHLGTLVHYALTLHLPQQFLWFDLPNSSRMTTADESPIGEPVTESSGIAVVNIKFRAARESVPSKKVPGYCMSRAELAEAVNDYIWRSTNKRHTALDAQAIGKYERGETQWPTDIYREAFRAVLGKSTDTDLGFNPTRRGSTARAPLPDVAMPTLKSETDSSIARERTGLVVARKKKGYTQETFAHALGVDLSTVGRWERAQQDPQPWMWPDIAKKLDITTDQLAELLKPEPTTDIRTASVDRTERDRDQAVELRQKLHASGQIDNSIVDLIRIQLDNVRRLDRQLGAVVVHEEVRAKADQIESLGGVI